MSWVSKILIGLSLMMAVSAVRAEMMPPDGLPLPWPFPWAKECPVNWEDMQGRYELKDSSGEQEIEITIAVVTKDGLQRVHVFHYGRAGDIVSHGISFVNRDQRALRLKLIPINRDGPPVEAVIRLHYQSWVFSCNIEELVPILTVDRSGGSEPTQTQYQLVRRTAGRN